MTNKHWDFEPDDKDAKRILKMLEVFITKNYGKRCKALAPHCSCCQVWSAFDNLKLSI